MMQTKRVLLVLLAGVLSVALAQDNPVSTRIEAFIVSRVTGEAGTQEERFTEATSARPGQTVEYRVFVRNEGDTTLPENSVVVTGPVPEGTRYLEDSATPSSEQVLTEYTVDGSTYREPPIVVNGSGGGERTVADATEYQAVRWTLREPLEPGQEKSFYYRVTVE